MVNSPSIMGDGSVSIGDEPLALRYFTDEAMALIRKVSWAHASAN